jgi:drug/metabolite transporter (DMT)-like permease
MLLLSGLCWASIAILSKIGINSGLNATTLNTARLTIGGSLIFIWLWLFRRDAIKIDFKSGVLLFFLGLFDYAIGGVLFLGSLHFIDSSLAFLMLYTYPALVVIVSAIAGREKFHWLKLAAVLLTFVGVGLVLQAGAIETTEQWIGVGMVLGASLIFSIYLVIVESMMDRFRTSTLSLYTILFGAVGMFMILPFFPIELDAVFQPGNIVILLIVSIVSTAFALVFFLMGVRHVGATKAAVITTLEPVFVVVIASSFLGEFITGWQWLGILLQLGGVILVNMFPHKPQEPVV